MTSITLVQKDTFDKNGWLILNDALGLEVKSSLSRWIDEISKPATKGESKLHYYEKLSEQHHLCRTERFIEDHVGLRKLIVAGEIPKIASSLMGSEVCLYKEKINYKVPGGAGFHPHQDASAYNDDLFYITCLIAVDPMNEENGCLQFASTTPDDLLGTQTSGCIDNAIAKTIEWRPAIMDAGSVIFFSSLIPHKSDTNHSNSSRRAIYLTFNSKGQGSFRNTYYSDRQSHLENSNKNADYKISTIAHFKGSVVRT